ncbi:MAG: superoxide dismutase [Actinobacteria bacterium]|nr:superoxide dismutase [Actinomycetota bacterium]|tara:strand:+ start:219 stop:860 length:642 start_codon:yes stop_codon:yes gene_type:complete
MSYQLPELKYEASALAPHIDEATMQIHHGKHHQAYISKLNAAIEGTSLGDQPIEQLIQNLDQVPEDKRAAVRNNGGGHANHSLFWEILTPNGTGTPSGTLLEDINQAFGSLDAFKTEFANAAATRFGSGWAWLCVKESGQLCVCSTPNQDSPLMKGVVDCAGAPILGLDVWEHAYYLNYQNRRPDYITAFWNVVNWDQVAENYARTKGLSGVA